MLTIKARENSTIADLALSILRYCAPSNEGRDLQVAPCRQRCLGVPPRFVTHDDNKEPCKVRRLWGDNDDMPRIPLIFPSFILSVPVSFRAFIPCISYWSIIMVLAACKMTFPIWECWCQRASFPKEDRGIWRCIGRNIQKRRPWNELMSAEINRRLNLSSKIELAISALIVGNWKINNAGLITSCEPLDRCNIDEDFDRDLGIVWLPSQPWTLLTSRLLQFLFLIWCLIHQCFVQGWYRYYWMYLGILTEGSWIQWRCTIKSHISFW